MEAELETIKEALQNNDHAKAVEIIMDFLNNQNNIPLNIAVTGVSGSGKSTFVNAFRGITNGGDGAAPTGCVETTTEVKAYPHPDYRNVILWDLPGIGTTNFPADKYLDLVKLMDFDFFIIISANRFTENDFILARVIGNMGRRFYFIRSKIDNDLYNESMTQRVFDKEITLNTIRGSCIQGLQDAGFESPQVFLVSSFNLCVYDFPQLQETLETELPEEKRNALLFAMPNINLEIITKKKNVFRSQIKYYALTSVGAAAVPVPGLSPTVDVSVLLKAVTEYKHGFGLDEKSLRRLAATSGVPYKDLMPDNASQLCTSVITQEFIVISLKSIINRETQEWSSLSSSLGIPLTMGLSFCFIYSALNRFLDELAEDAKSIFRKALKRI